MQSIMDTENNFLPMTAPSFMFIIGMHYSEALILDQFDTSLYHSVPALRIFRFELLKEFLLADEMQPNCIERGLIVHDVLGTGWHPRRGVSVTGSVESSLGSKPLNISFLLLRAVFFSI